jgi:hypothetical protein
VATDDLKPLPEAVRVLRSLPPLLPATRELIWSRQYLIESWLRIRHKNVGNGVGLRSR